MVIHSRALIWSGSSKEREKEGPEYDTKREIKEERRKKRVPIKSLNAFAHLQLQSNTNETHHITPIS
jgi:hypothetical protein